MSENEEKLKKPRRKRREFTPEFKAGAVKLVLEEGKTTTQVAQDLDLTESALRIWVQQAKADRGAGKAGALTTAEREVRWTPSFGPISGPRYLAPCRR
jgi:transposase